MLSAKEAHFRKLKEEPLKASTIAAKSGLAMANMRRATMGMSSGHSGVLSRRDSSVGSLGTSRSGFSSNK